MQRMWAVVPIKQFDIAKKRLADVLAGDERIALARAMLHDVLGALDASALVAGVIIVSREQSVVEIAARYGAEVVREAAHDLSLAVKQGAETLAARGHGAMLTVPGDVPLVSAREVDALVGAHRGPRALTLCSDRDGTGTNGLVVSPLDLIDFHFGANSCSAHASAAVAAGAQVATLELEGMSLDIDTPDDLVRLMDYRRQSATHEYLRSIDVVSRMPPRHNIGHAVVG